MVKTILLIVFSLLGALATVPTTSGDKYEICLINRKISFCVSGNHWAQWWNDNLFLGKRARGALDNIVGKKSL